MLEPVSGETWGTLFRIVAGAWLIVWVYAALHDQFLIRFAPEHFTVYHYHISLTQDLTLLAILYSLGASISPGLVFGIGLYLLGRLLARPKLSVRRILLGTLWIPVATESLALGAGLWTWKTAIAPYPGDWYPHDAPNLMIAQSIQITLYLAGTLFCLAHLAWMGQRVLRASTLMKN